jgi:hypothetical protein
MSKSSQGVTSKLNSKVSETKGFGEDDSRSVLFSLPESFLGNEFDGFCIFSGSFPLSNRSKFRRFCFSRDRTCPFSTLDAIERRVLCTRLRLTLSGSSDGPGNGLFLSSAREVLIWCGLESDTLLLPLPSASEIVGDLEFKACLLVKALVGVAGNNVSTWRLQRGEISRSAHLLHLPGLLSSHR